MSRGVPRVGDLHPGPGQMESSNWIRRASRSDPNPEQGPKIRTLAIVTALFVSVVVAAPQIRYAADGHYHAVIENGDEMAYAAKVRDVIDGHWRAASPYAWEHKGAPALAPYGGEMFLGAVSRVTGFDLDSVIILTRFVAPAVSALLLVHILFALTGSPAWSALGAGTVLLEPGTYYYKPVYYATGLIQGFTRLTEAQLPYTRFLNPLLLIIPFLVAALFLLRVLERHRAKDVIIAGLALGVSFYTQPYYATYVVVWLGLLLVRTFLSDRSRCWALVAVALLGLLAGSHAILENAQKFQGQSLEIVNRFGGGLHTRSPFYLFHKGAIFSGLAFALLYRQRSVTYWFLLSGMVGGFALLNQNILTGVEILNYHYSYCNAVVATCALMTLGADRFSGALQWMSKRQTSFVLPALQVGVALWLVINGLIFQNRSYAEHMRSSLPWQGGYPSNIRDEFPRTIAWIDANTPTDAVFLADAQVSFAIPVFTHANVFLDPSLNDDAVAFMSEAELFERYMIHLKLRGATAEEVFDMVRFKPPMPFPSWKFGMTGAMEQKYDLAEAAAFVKALETDSLARDYVAAFKAFSRQDVERGVKKYRLDYLVLSDRDSGFQRTAPGYFPSGSLKPIVSIREEGAEILQIGWLLPGSM